MRQSRRWVMSHVKTNGNNAYRKRYSISLITPVPMSVLLQPATVPNHTHENEILSWRLPAACCLLLFAWRKHGAHVAPLNICWHSFQCHAFQCSFKMKYYAVLWWLRFRCSSPSKWQMPRVCFIANAMQEESFCYMSMGGDVDTFIHFLCVFNRRQQKNRKKSSSYLTATDKMKQNMTSNDECTSIQSGSFLYFIIAEQFDYPDAIQRKWRTLDCCSEY